jgi:hypothetical protein
MNAGSSFATSVTIHHSIKRHIPEGRIFSNTAVRDSNIAQIIISCLLLLLQGDTVRTEAMPYMLQCFPDIVSSKLAVFWGVMQYSLSDWQQSMVR